MKYTGIKQTQPSLKTQDMRCKKQDALPQLMIF